MAEYLIGELAKSLTFHHFLQFLDKLFQKKIPRQIKERVDIVNKRKVQKSRNICE